MGCLWRAYFTSVSVKRSSMAGCENIFHPANCIGSGTSHILCARVPVQRGHFCLVPTRTASAGGSARSSQLDFITPDLPGKCVWVLALFLLHLAVFQGFGPRAPERKSDALGIRSTLCPTSLHVNSGVPGTFRVRFPQGENETGLHRAGLSAENLAIPKPPASPEPSATAPQPICKMGLPPMHNHRPCRGTSSRVT